MADNAATTSKGVAAGVIGLGVLLIWSGMRGAKLTTSLRDLIAGKQPPAGTLPIVGTSAATSGSGSGSGSGSTVTDSVIANTALQYAGVVPYVWGASSPKGWDCSGMVNYVIGHQLGMAIPGYPNGNYTGHGPVTEEWYVWDGATTIPVSETQAGDLVCWFTHMGIAVSNTELISALDTQSGTIVTTFAGASPGEPMSIRRLNA
jgi:cell wall-associated NlpC family hydrolase